MKKPSLSKALKLAESAAGLARALHVSASTVRRWKEGVSEKGAEKLSRFLERQDKLATRRKEDRNRIYELMKLADVEGKLPSLKSGTKPRSGRLTIGVQHVKNFKLMLTYDVLDDIDMWLRSLQKRFSTWQLLAVISQYGVGNHQGYKTVYVPNAPDAGDFAISANVATHATKSLREAESTLREKLEEVIEGTKVIAFLHSVTAFNYNKRKPEESSAWETQQRHKREDKAKKWRKKEDRTIIADLSEENERLRKELAKTKPKPKKSKAKAKAKAKAKSQPSSKAKPSPKKAKSKAKKALPNRPSSQPSSRSSRPSKTTVLAPKSKRARPSAPKASKASTKKSKQPSRQSSKRTPTRAPSRSTSAVSVKRSKKVSSKSKVTKKRSR